MLAGAGDVYTSRKRRSLTRKQYLLTKLVKVRIGRYKKELIRSITELILPVVGISAGLCVERRKPLERHGLTVACNKISLGFLC
jgi:hypothetical protein